MVTGREPRLKRPRTFIRLVPFCRRSSKFHLCIAEGQLPITRVFRVCFMSVNETFVALLEECLAGVGPITVRRMFGGAGVYADGTMFALVADDELYFKADEATRGAFEAEGLGPFVYDARGKPMTMSYWRIPGRLFDDPAEMTAWARSALAVARRKPGAKGAGSGKPKRRDRGARGAPRPGSWRA